MAYKHDFSQFLEARKSKSKVLADSVSGEDLFLRSDTAIFLLCPQLAVGARELSAASFMRALIPFMRAPPSQPNHFPKAPPPNAITLGVRT